LIKPGFSVVVEDSAGVASHFNNADYEAVGASIASSADELYSKSDIILKLRPPTPEEAAKVADKTLVSFVYPGQNKDLVSQLQDQKATVFAMDCIPRTLSRGQTYDALSSQANISGYRAVIEASNEFGRFFAG
jgi:NAD(P) transhydrogenase